MSTAALFGDERRQASPLELVVEGPRGPYTVLRVGGEVDLYTAPRLGAALRSLAGAGKHRVVVDCGGVEFLDSTGLRVLMECWLKFQGFGGVLKVACAANSVRKTFALTGLDRVIPVYPSVEQALNA